MVVFEFEEPAKWHLRCLWILERGVVDTFSKRLINIYLDLSLQDIEESQLAYNIRKVITSYLLLIERLQ